jgi:DMSO reductase family type II enzyme heme b subunit
VQFPATLPSGAERPYFLAGSTRSPVYLWYWQSRAERAVEARGRGMDRIEPLPPAREPLEVSARHGQGEWQVVFRRSLVTDSASAADRLQFRAGEPIPVAFLAWDGSNGESGSRAAISTWYFVYLDQPTPATTYAAPAVAMLLTAGLGLMVVGRAQRRERQLEKGL